MQDKFEQHEDAIERAELHQEYDRTLAQIKAAYDKAIAPVFKQYRLGIEKADEQYKELKQMAANDDEQKRARAYHLNLKRIIWSEYLEATNHENTIQIAKVREASIKLNEEIEKIDEQLFGNSGKGESDGHLS